jgi:hypothetical protein
MAACIGMILVALILMAAHIGIAIDRILPKKSWKKCCVSESILHFLGQQGFW